MDEAHKIVIGSKIDGSYSREGWLAVFVRNGNRIVLWRNTDAGHDGVDATYLDGGYFSFPVTYHKANALFKTMVDANRAIEQYAEREGLKKEDLNAEVHKVIFSLSMEWVL